MVIFHSYCDITRGKSSTNRGFWVTPSRVDQLITVLVGEDAAGRTDAAHSHGRHRQPPGWLLQWPLKSVGDTFLYMGLYMWIKKCGLVHISEGFDGTIC